MPVTTFSNQGFQGRAERAGPGWPLLLGRRRARDARARAGTYDLVVIDRFKCARLKDGTIQARGGRYRAWPQETWAHHVVSVSAQGRAPQHVAAANGYMESKLAALLALVAASRSAGSQRGSHPGERLPTGVNESGQAGGDRTSPRTDPDDSEQPDMYLRIRRSCPYRARTDGRL